MGLFVHTCEVCKNPAAFGFGCNLLKNIIGTWYCRDHRHAGTEKIKTAQHEPLSDKQGVLL